MGAGYRPTEDDWLQDAWHEQNAADAAAGTYPITRRSLERLRALVREAHEIAASVRDNGPSAVHCEAYNLAAGIADVDTLVQALTAALAEAGQRRRQPARVTNDPERGGLSRVRLTEQLGPVAGED